MSYLIEKVNKKYPKKLKKKKKKQENEISQRPREENASRRK